MFKLIFILALACMVSCVSRKVPKPPTVDTPTVKVSETKTLSSYFTLTMDASRNLQVNFQGKNFKIADTQALDSLIKVQKIREENHSVAIVFPPNVSSGEAAPLIDVFKQNGITNLNFLVNNYKNSK